MDIKFTDTFAKSFEKMINSQRLYWKTIDFFRYDLPAFLKNIWWFRKALWNFRWYSWNDSLDMFKTSIAMQEKYFHNGHEENISRNKKIIKMQRVIYLMDNFIDDKFVDLAENTLGPIIHHDWIFEPAEGHPNCSQIKDQDTPDEKKHNKKVYELARKIETEQWTELWKTIKGQDYSKFKVRPEDDMDHDKGYDYWVSQFDGSGLLGWWS